MYISSSLKQKSQSLLNGQSVHLPEVENTKDRGNSPDSELCMREQRVLTPYSAKVIPPHLIRHCRGGGGGGGSAAPSDVGLQTEIGRTSKGRGEEAPAFKTIPRAGGQPSGEAWDFRFTLLFFLVSTSRRARSSPRVGFEVKGSNIEDEEDLETGGKEGFMTERGECIKKGSRAGLAPDGPGISDLMSSE